MIATPPAQSMRRLWRRRRYQRLGSDTGHARSRSFRLGRLSRMSRRASALQSKIASPLKLLSKFHDAYVEMMMRVAKSSVGNMYAIGAFGNGKRNVIPKPDHSQVSNYMALCGGEQVDVNLVLEMYNKIAANSKNLLAAAF